MSAAMVEGLVIGGERVAAAEGASFDVQNPATGNRSHRIRARSGGRDRMTAGRLARNRQNAIRATEDGRR